MFDPESAALQVGQLELDLRREREARQALQDRYDLLRDMVWRAQTFQGPAQLLRLIQEVTAAHEVLDQEARPPERFLPDGTRASLAERTRRVLEARKGRLASPLEQRIIEAHRARKDREE